MNKDKTNHFNSKQQRLAELAKALAHPARVAILQTLAAADECICGDFVDQLPLSQSTVSQHLKELKNAGLICASAHPPKMFYCLNKEVWKEWEELQQLVFPKGGKTAEVL
ncbi:MULTISPECIES: ArsR/SmtB family transcription factor [Persicobacter]|uniref:Transcriptional regulator n=1 Tax=Persicobacter diffluens TaxID=981 RepID=A0AAN4W0J3_9BACT|nr:metalloregulator ArsR/SmtB family transcription factor [Persicobacter sp. CCB-QB2]GJM62250.1 transcriptional regulator [Persicobacter diffluens]